MKDMMKHCDVNSCLADNKNCQAKTESMEQSFLLLNKTLRKDDNFLPDNVGDFILPFRKLFLFNLVIHNIHSAILCNHIN